jgi:hypothetical protein
VAGSSAILFQLFFTMATPRGHPNLQRARVAFLPAPLSFLYYFFRPLRLTVRYLRLALRRLLRRKRSGPASDSPDSKQERCDPA